MKFIQNDTTIVVLIKAEITFFFLHHATKSVLGYIWEIMGM